MAQEYDKYVVGVSHPNLSIPQKQAIANSYGGTIDVFVEATISGGYIQNDNGYLVIPFVDMMWLYYFEPFTWELQVKGIEGNATLSPIFGIPELYDFFFNIQVQQIPLLLKRQKTCGQVV